VPVSRMTPVESLGIPEIQPMHDLVEDGILDDAVIAASLSQRQAFWKLRDEMSAAYRFLRRVEHRLQMVADEQTHALPDSVEAVERFAHFFGYESRAAFASELLGHLGGIEETVLLYAGERGRPRARHMLTDMDPIQQRLYNLFGLETYAPKR